MKITAGDLAHDSDKVLDSVIQNGETAEVQRDGKTVVEIRRKAGVDRRQLAELLGGIRFTEAETRELKLAMDAAAEVLGYAGRD